MGKNQKQPLKSFAALTRSNVHQLPSTPGEWEADGIDHICIDRAAATQLGRMLATGTDSNWTHPVLGYFRTLDNLWFFLSVSKPNDDLRRMPRQAALAFARKHCGGLDYYPNIEAVFADSIFRFVKQKKELTRMLVENPLPFDIYYNNASDIRQRRASNAWLVEVYYEVQAALRENRDIDVSRWVTHKDQHIYHDIMVALGADPDRIEELFNKSIESHRRNTKNQGQKDRKDRQRPVHEREVMNIDPMPGFKVKVRGQTTEAVAPKAEAAQVDNSDEGVVGSETSLPVAAAETTVVITGDAPATEEGVLVPITTDGEGNVVVSSSNTLDSGNSIYDPKTAQQEFVIAEESEAQEIEESLAAPVPVETPQLPEADVVEGHVAHAASSDDGWEAGPEVLIEKVSNIDVPVEEKKVEVPVRAQSTVTVVADPYAYTKQ